MIREAITGATSAVIANTIVYPLDVITSQIQVSTNPQHVLHNLSKKRFTFLYIGLKTSLLQTFLSNFGYFWFYALVKKLSRSRSQSVQLDLFLGAVAGALSRTCTTPISVLTMRKQTSDKGYCDIIRDILKTKGIKGFWRGYGASLVLTINPAITYGLYERFKGTKRRTPWQVFWLGAFTKSLATIITYPYILAKSQLQALDNVHSIIGCFQELIRQKGILGVYQGLSAQLSKAVLCQAFLFSFKEYLERVYSQLFLISK